MFPEIGSFKLNQINGQFNIPCGNWDVSAGPSQSRLPVVLKSSVR